MSISPATNQATVGAASSAYTDVVNPRTRRPEKVQPESPSAVGLPRELVVTEPASSEQVTDTASCQRWLDVRV